MPTLRGSRDTTWASVHMDAVRGTAALIVVLGHTRDLFFDSLTAPAESVAKLGGAVGLPVPRISIGNEAVMVFFVLSGFLVGGSVLRSTDRGNWSWADYLTRRLARLWVVLLPALVIGTVVDVLGQQWFSNVASIYSGPSAQVLVHDLAARLNLATFLGNVFFLQDIWFPTAGTNDSLWSLTNEFWYYILFPLLVFTVIRSRHGITRWMCGLGAVCLLYFVGRSIALLFPIWLLGAAVYSIPRRCPAQAARWLAGVLACAFPVLGIVIRRSSLPVYGAEWVIALCFSALLYLILHNVQPAGHGLYPRSAAFLSRISYSLYLSHLPFAVLGCALMNSPWRRWPFAPRYFAMYVVLNSTLLAVAYLFYLLFESRTDQVRSFVERCFRLSGVRSTVPAE